MERTLDILRAAIIGQGVATIDQRATALGISVEEDGIYVRFNDASRLPFATERDVLVMKLNVEQRPHLLYLIPVHPTVRSDDPAEDEYGHMVLSERLRSSLFMHIASQLEDGAVTISWDAVMADAILVWSQWGEEGKTNLLRPFKRFVRQVFKAFDRRFSTQTEESRFQVQITLHNVQPVAIPRILNYLTSNAYRKGEIHFDDPLQLPLPSDTTEIS